jgi:hypothetical protein
MPFVPDTQQPSRFVPDHAPGMFEKMGLPKFLDTFNDATTHAANMATLGLSDEANAAGDILARKAANAVGLNVPQKSWGQAHGEQQAILDNAAARSPIASTAGGIVGSLTTIPKGIGNAVVSATYPAMIGRGALTGGLTGAGYGFTTGSGGLEGRLNNAETSGALGALTGGVLGGVGARQAQKATRQATQQAAHDLFGDTAATYNQLKMLPAYTDQTAVKAIVPKMDASLRAENMSEEVHPKAFNTVKTMQKAFDNAPQTPGTLEAWRRRIKTDLLKSNSPDEREAGRILMDNLDNFVSSGSGGPVASAARATFRKSVQADKLDFAIKQAERTSERGGKNFTHHLATQLQQLVVADERAIAKGRPPQFDKAMRDKMERVAANRGGKILDWIGNFSPEGRLPAMLNLFAGTGAAIASGGTSLIPQAILGATGMAAKAASRARATNAVNSLQQGIIGKQFPPQISGRARAIIDALTRGAVAARQ